MHHASIPGVWTDDIGKIRLAHSEGARLDGYMGHGIYGLSGSDGFFVGFFAGYAKFFPDFLEFSGTQLTWVASRKGNHKALAFLLKAGAPVFGKNSEGNSALDIAHEYDHSQCASLLYPYFRDEHFLFPVGTHVKHETHGVGEVVEHMADGRTRVRFANGEEHRYSNRKHTHWMIKITPKHETIRTDWSSTIRRAALQTAFVNHDKKINTDPYHENTQLSFQSLAACVPTKSTCTETSVLNQFGPKEPQKCHSVTCMVCRPDVAVQSLLSALGQM